MITPDDQLRPIESADRSQRPGHCNVESGQTEESPSLGSIQSGPMAELPPAWREYRLPPKGGLIYDLDGTVCDSQLCHQMAWRWAGEKYGATVTPAFLEFQKGRTNEDATLHLLEVERYAEIGKAFVEEKKRLAVYHANRAVWYPDFLAVWPALLASKRPIWICTASQRAFVTAVLALQPELAPLADHIVSREDYNKGKPHSEPILTTCARMGLPPSSCLYVGDARVDYEASRSAGCRFVYYCPVGSQPDDSGIPASTPRISDHRQIVWFL